MDSCGFCFELGVVLFDGVFSFLGWFCSGKVLAFCVARFEMVRRKSGSLSILTVKRGFSIGWLFSVMMLRLRLFFCACAFLNRNLVADWGDVCFLVVWVTKIGGGLRWTVEKKRMAWIPHARLMVWLMDITWFISLIIRGDGVIWISLRTFPNFDGSFPWLDI